MGDSRMFSPIDIVWNEISHWIPDKGKRGEGKEPNKVYTYVLMGEW